MSIRTAENADAMVEALTSGKPLREFCREMGWAKSTVYDWLDSDPALSGRFAQARARGGHEIADQCIEIADDDDLEPADKKVRIETRLKLLAKWNPKEYGDKVTTELTGANGGPVQSAVMVTFKRREPDGG